MASSGKGGLHGLTDDELRVMKYFAKTGGSRTVKSVVSGVERYTFNVDAISDPNEDLYHDRADVEVPSAISRRFPVVRQHPNLTLQRPN